ncbi:MAG: hypothetical protein ABT19_13240 [Rhodanobacter sp. SCN 68-63]|nr:MAG: hypothetical protein ABT19_13240 [Rhodanobacter sp. SCN 68-63]
MGRAQAAEVHVFQVRRDGDETLARRAVGQHVDLRASGHQAGGEDGHAGAVTVQFVLVDRASPHAAFEAGDRFQRFAGEQHLALGKDRHARTQVGDVLHDVGGEDHHRALADLRQQVEEAVALLRIQPGGGLVDDH